MYAGRRRRRSLVACCALVLLLASAAPALTAAPPSAEPVPIAVGAIGCFGANCLVPGADEKEGAVFLLSGGTTGSPQNVPGTDVLWEAACGSPTSCMAIGYVYTSAPNEGNGNTVAVAVPVVNGTPGPAKKVKAFSYLYDIACPTSSSCVAVGTARTGTGSRGVGAFVTFTGGQAGAVKSVPGTGDIGLGGIACPTATECVATAIGLGDENGIVRIKNGAAGPLVRNNFGNQGLTGPIACVSVSRCIAAKYDEFVTVRGTKVGKPKAATTGKIKSITCISAISCITAKGAHRALQVSIDGNYGRGVDLLPRKSDVVSVACMSATACVAGGDSEGTAQIVRFAPPPPVCVVPKVVGKKLAKAKSLLKAASCRAGKIKKRPGSASKRGKVVAQAKKPGTRRPAGTKVVLTVGS